MRQPQAVLEDDRGSRRQVVGRLGHDDQRIDLLALPLQAFQQALGGVEGQVGEALPLLRHAPRLDADVAHQAFALGAQLRLAVGQVEITRLGTQVAIPAKRTFFSVEVAMVRVRASGRGRPPCEP